MAIQCRVQEVIGVLAKLGLPLELARELVYKWKVVEHPTAIAIKTDPWLRRVREQYERQSTPNITTCVCPRNYNEDNGFDWDTTRLHHRLALNVWPTMSPYAKQWMERINGPLKNQPNIITIRCSRSVLCMRHFRHTIPSIDAHVREEQVGALDQDPLGYVDTITNDISLATWLRYAPINALVEYLLGVTGWTKEKMEEVLNWQFGDWFVNRNDIVRMCMEH